MLWSVLWFSLPEDNVQNCPCSILQLTVAVVQSSYQKVFPCRDAFFHNTFKQHLDRTARILSRDVGWRLCLSHSELQSGWQIGLPWNSVPPGCVLRGSICHPGWPWLRTRGQAVLKGDCQAVNEQTGILSKMLSQDLGAAPCQACVISHPCIYQSGLFTEKDTGAWSFESVPGRSIKPWGSAFA